VPWFRPSSARLIDFWISAERLAGLRALLYQIIKNNLCICVKVNVIHPIDRLWLETYSGMTTSERSLVSPDKPNVLPALSLPVRDVLASPAVDEDAPPPRHSDDPLNWSVSRRWIVTAALSASGFNRIIVSTIMAPALPSIQTELGLTSLGATAALGAFILATAFSPLLAGPLSEIYGRSIILHSTNIWFLAFNIASGFVRTGPSLIVCRLFAGFGAGAIYSLGSGVMGDMWPPERRGRTLAIYMLIPLLGAAVGPIVGGYVEQYTTWRWIFWSTSIAQAMTVVICFIWFRETHLPTIRARQENKGNPFRLPSIPRHTFAKSIRLPLNQLFTHRSVQFQAVLSGLGYGITYLVLSTYSSLFTGNYHQSISKSGLHYIGPMLGEIIGSQIGGRLMELFARKAKRVQKTDRFEPEFHLPVIVPGAISALCGFCLYGWAAQRLVHWIVVDVGAMILSAGLQMTGQGLQAYNMDTYPESRASTTAAVQMFRSLGAFALPLAGPKMYAQLGYGWANTLLGSVYLGGHLGATMYLWKCGAALRGADKASPLRTLRT
jgi:MFS family permease